jgi:hypothetical protein
VCILQAWAGFETNKKAGGWGNIPGFKGLPAQDTQSIGLFCHPFSFTAKENALSKGQQCLNMNNSINIWLCNACVAGRGEGEAGLEFKGIARPY